MPTVQIFDPAQITAILGKAGFSSEFAYGEPSNEQRRLEYLETLASDPRKGQRELLMADASMLVELQRLAAAAPNFADAMGIVIRAANLSFLTGSPFSLPPLLLVGPPGVGKSYVARRLAEALGTPLISYPMNLADDSGVLVGHSLSWRGSRAGLLARALIENASASPVVFVDEIDKALWSDHGDPLDVFHSLLEPENARGFVDAYIAEAPIRADMVLWIATANDLSGLKPSLIDRFIVLHIDPPDAEGRKVVLQGLFGQALARTQAQLSPDLEREILMLLAEVSPRRSRLVLDLAIAHAVSAQRDHIGLEDVRDAMRLVGDRASRRMGF